MLVDAGHYNVHTVEGRYKPFAELLRSDGYVVLSLASRFDRRALDAGRILVVSNALAERNDGRDNQGLPTYSAFAEDEVEAVREWVREGGSLLLIADHMPFPGAAEDLAAAFGVRFSNGYAVHEERLAPRPPLVFRRSGDQRGSDGSLADHPITDGRDASERVETVLTFTGQAFRSELGHPLLIFGPSILSLLPERPAVFDEDTPRVPVEGWYQGLVLKFGQGRAAFFGEAAMFSAQTTGEGRTMGLNAPGAEQNSQLLLNLMHWLSGILPD